MPEDEQEQERRGPTPPGKRQRTRQQRIKLRKARERGEELRLWMWELLHKAKEPREAIIRGGHGITRQLNNIEPPPPQWVHKHADDTSRWERRHLRLEQGGKVYHRTAATGRFGTTRDRNRRRRADVVPAVNTPYVNLDRETSRKLKGRRK